LSGEGAFLYGGRWNFPKTRMLYTASSGSLSLLEMLVHLPNYQIDTPFALITIEIPDQNFPRLEIEKLPQGWNSFSSFEVSRMAGFEAFNKFKSLGLFVPSVVMSLDFNFLIDPLHPDFSKIKIVDQMEYTLEKRFRK